MGANKCSSRFPRSSLVEVLHGGAKFGTHIQKFNTPNRGSPLLVWGLGVCVKARSLGAGIILDVGVRSNPM